MGNANNPFDVFDCLSPIDYRYWDRAVANFLSENAYVHYKLKMELALVTVLCKRGLCSQQVVDEVAAACQQVTTSEVYEEEGRIFHDIRALVNSIQAKVSDEAKPFVHLGATSYDIVEPANALRFRNVVQQVLLPTLRELLKVLINKTRLYADATQVGRTHGQHAVPITFGFAMAEYVSRLGQSIVKLQQLSEELTAKFSGAVGAYNASSLFFEDPLDFEREVLAEVGLKPGQYSTQIAPPEPMVRLLVEVAMTMSILANLADDMRNLQRTEIGEVGELFDPKQVGSSTMPQKRNPIGFENTKSLWKLVLPRLMTVFMDMLSDHQRDLTGSASMRTAGEIIGYTHYAAKRLVRVMNKLVVDKGNLAKNLQMTQGLILAEPLYLILAALGHPNAHEKVRQMTLDVNSKRGSLGELLATDPELQPYLERFTNTQKAVISNPLNYIGIAPQKALQIADYWDSFLNA